MTTVIAQWSRPQWFRPTDVQSIADK